jgi:hypothetical protein
MKRVRFRRLPKGLYTIPTYGNSQAKFIYLACGITGIPPFWVRVAVMTTFLADAHGVKAISRIRRDVTEDNGPIIVMSKMRRAIEGGTILFIKYVYI